MPDDDDPKNAPESLPTILPIWGKHTCSFTPVPETIVTRVKVPFGWGPVIDPEDGVRIGHLVRTDMPRLIASAELGAARQGAYGFRFADEHERPRS